MNQPWNIPCPIRSSETRQHRHDAESRCDQSHVRRSLMREHDRLAANRIPTITGKTQRAQTKRLQRNKHSRKKERRASRRYGERTGLRVLITAYIALPSWRFQSWRSQQESAVDRIREQFLLAAAFTSRAMKMNNGKCNHGRKCFAIAVNNPHFSQRKEKQKNSEKHVFWWNVQEVGWNCANLKTNLNS